jgi:hypothetical protein
VAVVTLPRAARPLTLLVAFLTGAGTVALAAGAPRLPAQVPVEARWRVQPVTEQASLAVKVDGEPFVASREIFEYLLDHPEFATHVTRVLKLARYRIWQTPAGLGIDDGWGMVGTFELVHAGQGVRLMYARGVYQQRILPDIHGQAVVLIDYGLRPEPDGRSTISAAVTGFVKLDSRLLELASRLASSVARAKGEKEARRLVRLFARTTRAIEAEPAAVYEQVRRSPGVPAGDLEGFRRLLNLGDAEARTAPGPAAR